jgi:excinuclease ABC subunit A
MENKKIIIRGAREHNLKNIDIGIPRDKLVVITGLSGSGKSSLAFDTIYAEGQRRYVESLSAYARQFLELMEKPDVDSIEGLSPAISIEQKKISKNPRSTVGTVTEIYDYLRLFFARIGIPHCYICGREITSQTIQQMVDLIMEQNEGEKIKILAPIIRGRKGEYRKELSELQRDGFVRVRIDGEERELDEEIILDKNKKHHIDVVVDRLIGKSESKGRLTESLELALKLAKGLVKIVTDKDKEVIYSEMFSCPLCGISYPEITPRMFSFNNPYGACPSCNGLGKVMYFDVDLIIPDKDVPLKDGAFAPWSKKNSLYFYQMLSVLAEKYGFDLSLTFRQLPQKNKDVILYGSGEEKLQFYYEDNGKKFYFRKSFEGILKNLDRRYKNTNSEAVRGDLSRFMNFRLCADCNGMRLKKESLHVKINGKTIHDISQLSIDKALDFFSTLNLNSREYEIARRIVKEIIERLGFLHNVGVGYLTLDRGSATLSGGEGQRIRLATQIGSSLVGVLYILDEPSIGLHQRDNAKLIDNLKKLRDLGNTILVVEHDAKTILESDYVIDMGPGAGLDGGYLVFQGSPKEILLSDDSLTGKYLAKKIEIKVPEKRRPHNGKYLKIKDARGNNLKNIDLKLPLGLFICVTGVSGSGKSTLLIDTIYRYLAKKIYKSKESPAPVDSITNLDYIDKVISIDQSPIGKTPRSNPVTYTGVFTFIRELFTKTQESRVRGYKPSRFSFNLKGGRCEACEGGGIIKVEMHFLPDVYVTCELCHGKRYNRETLEIHYKGKNIADILDMTVNQALSFFSQIPKIKAKLETLSDVGLGYIKLGQSATTLSGGESQRVKLSRELSKKSTGKTFYILDEPTTGLHFADIKNLLNVLFRLTDKGNTIVVIEHNPDVIKCADYIIDLGPEGGEEGGRIIAQGTPEKICKIKESYTGMMLKEIL